MNGNAKKNKYIPSLVSYTGRGKSSVRFMFGLVARDLID